MFVRELGSGSSVVLLLHGAPSPPEDLLPVGDRLGARHRVLIPDLPGYGATPAGSDLSYDTSNRRLSEMLRERGVQRLRGIVGFSGGVMRALYLLLRARVEADVLVSLGGVAGLDDADRDAFRGFAALVRSDPQSVGSVAMHSMMAERMLSAAWRASHPDDGARVGRWLQLTSPADMATELDAGSETVDFRPELGEVRARAVARVGELDVACPVAKSRELVTGVRDGTLEIVAGHGHALLIEDAADTMDSIARALDG